MRFTIALASFFLSTLVSAAPIIDRSIKSCSVTSDKLSLPSNQTVLTIPAGVKPAYIGLGVGVQNYTCGANGIYASTGAVAVLYDASCIHSLPLIGSALFNSLPELIYDVMPSSPPLSTSAEIDAYLAKKLPSVISSALGKTLDADQLGIHYFIANPIPGGTGLSPKFDFSVASQKGNPNAFVTTKKIGDLPAPSGPSNVDWLELQNVQGQLAQYVFRVNTKGGQPPSTCTAGQSASIKYTAEYWFFN